MPARIPWLAAALVLILTAGAAAQQPDAAQERREAQGDAQAEQSSTQVPVSMDRIREGLTFERALKLPVDLPPLEMAEEAQRPMFRVEVFGQPPTLQSLIEGMDLKSGPVPFSSPTHSEFLAMVTPKELYSSAGFTAMELLTAGLSAKAIEWMIARAVAEARERAEREELDRVNRQIERELREIESPRRNPPNP